MALQIGEGCIDCDVCQSLCPNNAIVRDADAFVIDPALCTECAGDTPQCQENCPVECIVPAPHAA